MDSEPFCDLECGVEPVEDFHDSFVTCEEWEELARRALDFAADMARKCDNWRETTYRWQRVAEQAIAQRHWVENTALVSLLVLLVIVVVKSL
jgi:hypothetical protein